MAAYESAEVDVACTICYDLVHPKFDSATFMPGVSKYDAGSVGDPLAAPEYVTDIFQRLYDREVRPRFVSSVATLSHTPGKCPHFFLHDFLARALHFL
jgi:hypothetical protein